MIRRHNLILLALFITIPMMACAQIIESTQRNCITGKRRPSHILMHTVQNKHSKNLINLTDDLYVVIYICLYTILMVYAKQMAAT